MFESIKRVLLLIRKELTSTMSDPVGRVVLFIPPVVQFIMFSFAISQDVVNTRVAILNQDVGVEGASLMKSFMVEPVFKEIVNVTSYRELDSALENQRVIAAIVIPQDFSRRVHSPGETPTIQVTLDGRRANGAGALGGYVQQIAARFGATPKIETSSERGLIVRRWFNPNAIARVAFMPGLVCIIMTTVGMIVSATSIARERELGSFEQLVVSPLSPLEIVIGKAASAVALATISAIVILLLVVFGFGTPLLGPLWLFMLSTALYLTAIICVGLFISSISTTQQQATLGLFLFMPPAIMLSGFATPVENMPEWLQFLTIPNPVRWELIVLKGLLTRGASVRSIAICLVPLALVAATTFSCAAFMFKRRME